MACFRHFIYPLHGIAVSPENFNPMTRASEEQELQQIREQVYDHEGRISVLETFIANQQTRRAETPVWVFGIWGAIGTLISTLVSLYMAGLL